MTSSSSGRRFGPFVLERELGRGSSGVVFLATREGSPERFALKIHTGPRDRESLIRLQLEAQIATKLEHPGIVKVRDQGLIDGRDFILMEFCEGESLSDRLHRGRFDWRQAAELVEQLARIMDVAHGQGVLHRDLKPANVILESSTGRPRIIDFGLARDPSLVKSLTQSQTVMGTPVTMAPEQMLGEPDVDARADVYALGVILYWCLTGTPPFLAATLVELQQLVLHVEPEPPRRVAPEIPRRLERLCLQALSKDRVTRPADAGVLALQLTNALRATDEGPSSQPPQPSRTRAVVGASFCVLGLAVGVVLAAVSRGSPQAGAAQAGSPPASETPAPDPAAHTQALLDDMRARSRDHAPLAELLTILERAEAAAGGDPSLRDLVRFERAEACRRRGDYHAAIAAAPVAAGGELGLAARWVRGLCLLRSGQGPEADEAFEALARDDPQGSNGLDAQVVILIRSGDPSWAEVAQRCGRAGPTDIHARLAAAYGLMDLESPSAALDALEVIGREAPDETHVYFITAFVRSSSGDSPGALEAYDEVLALTAPFASHQALLGKARHWMAVRDSEAAVADLDRLLAIDPACVQAHLWRGLCLWELGQESEARASWEEACRRRDPRTWEDELSGLPDNLARELRRQARELHR